MLESGTGHSEDRDQEGVRVRTAQWRVECRAARKADRSQCGCMMGAVWNAMQGKLGEEREEIRGDWYDRKNSRAK